MPPRMSDEDVGRQILGIFMRYRIQAGGTLRRNNFFDVRDADFQRGLSYAIASRWIKQPCATVIPTSLPKSASPSAGDRSQTGRPGRVRAVAARGDKIEPVTMAPAQPDPVATDEAPTVPIATDPWKSTA